MNLSIAPSIFVIIGHNPRYLVVHKICRSFVLLFEVNMILLLDKLQVICQLNSNVLFILLLLLHDVILFCISHHSFEKCSPYMLWGYWRLLKDSYIIIWRRDSSNF